jgi:hypothetical protein
MKINATPLILIALAICSCENDDNFSVPLVDGLSLYWDNLVSKPHTLYILTVVYNPIWTDLTNDKKDTDYHFNSFGWTISHV